MIHERRTGAHRPAISAGLSSCRQPKRFRARVLVAVVLIMQAAGVAAQAARPDSDPLHDDGLAGLLRLAGLEVEGAPAAGPFAGLLERAQRIAFASDRPAWGTQWRSAPVESLVAGGVIGGAAGWILGTVAIGLPLAHALPATDDGLSTPGVIIGLQVGQALGIATGVHRANARRGEFEKSLYVAVAAAALGMATLWTDDFDEVFETRRSQTILVAVPVVQLISSIHFARARASEPSPP